MSKSNLRVAIVTDWMYGGGGELVVEQLAQMYAEAPIYTSYCSNEWRERLNGRVRTGYLQSSPFRQLRKFLPLLRQRWFRKLDLSEFDLVISVSGNGEAKFVSAKNGLHINYCHTPVHFYWRHYQEYLNNPGFRPQWLVRLGMKLFVKPLRQRDYEAAQKVNYFIANSTHIRADIKEFYGRDSTVIHPPVDTKRFSDIESKIERYGYVAWGRHVPFKRIDLAIQACNELDIPLAIIGQGPCTKDLQAIAGPNTTFLGRISDEELARFANTRQAFLFTSFEDFGISPVEAMAAGLPIVAFKAGGALDYVQPGITGEYFAEQTVESLVDTLRAFRPDKYNAALIRKRASDFSNEHFRNQITAFVANYMGK